MNNNEVVLSKQDILRIIDTFHVGQTLSSRLGTFSASSLAKVIASIVVKGFYIDVQTKEARLVYATAGKCMARLQYGTAGMISLFHDHAYTFKLFDSQGSWIHLCFDEPTFDKFFEHYREGADSDESLRHISSDLPHNIADCSEYTVVFRNGSTKEEFSKTVSCALNILNQGLRIDSLQREGESSYLYSQLIVSQQSIRVGILYRQVGGEDIGKVS